MPDFKKNARVRLKYAVDTGKLKRLPCEVCGEVKSEGHHEDYTLPLEVRWLCKKHHIAEHRKHLKSKCQPLLRRKTFTEAELPLFILALSEKCGSQKDFAKKMRISPSMLSDMISGRRNASDKFLAKIGLERVVTYRYIVNSLPLPVSAV